MSLNSITQIATQGLSAAQLGINTVSDNITNVNTTGYVQKVVNQEPTALNGLGDGVSTPSVTLAANQFLDNAANGASADVGQASIISSMLDQAQSLLGDPSATTGYFNQLNTVFSAFSAAANDPGSAVTATQAVNAVSSFLDQSQTIASSLNQMTGQADSQIGSDVTQVNQLLSQISSLNTSIVQANANGGDATDSQNAQNSLLSQLSSLMDFKVSTTATGGINLQTTSGQTLVSQAGSATLAYTPSTTGTSSVTIVQPGTGGSSSTLQLQSGEIQGLLGLRNSTLPGISDQVSEFVTQTVNALNAAHNANTTVPAPATLTGSNVGTDIPTALTGFTGTTNLAVVNSSGVVQQQVAIDFSAGTMTVAGGATTAFTPATFVSTLNTALNGTATVSVVNNALSISAVAGGDGIAMADSATSPSNKNGEGFSQYFGLNNLVNSSVNTNYQTGLQPTSANGFSGGVLTLRLSDGSGNEITDVPVTIPTGGTMASVLTALNAAPGGVGLYGKFSLSSTGAMSFTPNTPGGASVSVVSDTSQWGAAGDSVSQLFGLGDTVRGDRTNSFSVRSDIAANPTNIAFAQLNLSAAAGTAAISPGDSSGAAALANAGNVQMSFDAAGGMGAVTTTVSNYASQLAGSLATQSAAAASAQTNATAVQTEAQSRQQSVEGVNLDQELVDLTTYQQAYSASARLITASSDMFTSLIGMMGP